MNNSTFTEFYFVMIGRADIEGSKDRRILSRAEAGRRRVFVFSLKASHRGILGRNIGEDSSVELEILEDHLV